MTLIKQQISLSAEEAWNHLMMEACWPDADGCFVAAARFDGWCWMPVKVGYHQEV